MEHSKDRTIVVAEDKQGKQTFYEVSRSLADTLPANPTIDCVARYRPSMERPTYYEECYIGDMDKIVPAMQETGISPELDEFDIKSYRAKDVETTLLDRGVSGKDARLLSNSYNVNIEALSEAVTAQTPEETITMVKDVLAHPDRAAMYGTRAILINDYGVPKEDVNRAADTKEHAAILHAELKLDDSWQRLSQRRRERISPKVQAHVQETIHEHAKAHTYEEKAKAVAPKRPKIRLHSHQSSSKGLER